MLVSGHASTVMQCEEKHGKRNKSY